MSSSKFSSRPLVLKRPIVCKTAPPETPGELREYPPIQVQAFVHFVDLDPIQHARQQDLLILDWHPRAKLYFGRSAPTGDRLELTFTPTPVPEYWDAALVVYGWWIGPAPFFYPNVYVPIDRPFATANFGDVVISEKDYRVLQIKE